MVRVFQNLQEVREAVRRFVDTYNREWLVEKNGFLSPWQARAQWLAQASIAGGLIKTCVQKTGCGTFTKGGFGRSQLSGLLQGHYAAPRDVRHGDSQVRQSYTCESGLTPCACG